MPRWQREMLVNFQPIPQCEDVILGASTSILWWIPGLLRIVSLSSSSCRSMGEPGKAPFCLCSPTARATNQYFFWTQAPIGLDLPWLLEQFHYIHASHPGVWGNLIQHPSPTCDRPCKQSLLFLNSGTLRTWFTVTPWAVPSQTSILYSNLYV